MNPPPPTPSFCNSCGASRRRSVILHSFRCRTNHRCYCTNCLLKNHRDLFCPICFHVYDDIPPPHLRLACLHCPAIVHRSCVTGGNDSAAPSFQCPVCSDPNFSYFKPRFEGNGRSSGVGAVDDDSAKVLVAATRIAADSMIKTAATARFDAERRAKEAADARKKAKDALERLARIVAQEEKQRGDPEPKRQRKT